MIITAIDKVMISCRKVKPRFMIRRLCRGLSRTRNSKLTKRRRMKVKNRCVFKMNSWQITTNSANLGVTKSIATADFD